MQLSTANINYNNRNFNFYFRDQSEGDKGVLGQIFQNMDYDVSRWAQGRALYAYHAEKCRAQNTLIIDAGANIGASALYFLNTFENSYIYAIEPDDINHQILEINTANYPNKFNFKGGIANSDGELYFEDPGLSDWGFRTSAINQEKAENKKIVKSISVDTILSITNAANMTPLICKVDIEGGEQNLFEKNVDWMENFPLIIIELHDWMLPFSGSSRPFITASTKYDFDFIHRGENIFLFNKNILSKYLNN